MYDDSKQIETKEQYCFIVDETIGMLENMRQYSAAYEEIYDQLVDLKKNVIEEQTLVEPDDIDDRYSFGGIAVKSFKEGDEIRELLCDILWGTLHFQELNDENSD